MLTKQYSGQILLLFARLSYVKTILLNILPRKCVILITFDIRLKGEIDFKTSFPNQNIGCIQDSPLGGAQF